MNSTPATVNGDPETPDFTADQYTNTNLIVPKGSLQAYKDHAEWGKFKNITESNPSNVNELNGDDAVKVHVQNGAIVIENAAEGSTATVTSISGAIVAKVAIEETANIEVPAAGLYIVKVGNTVKKVMVK